MRIDFKRYDKPVEESLGGGKISGPLCEIMSDSKELKEVLKLMNMDTSVFWVSDGNWSMHQMLLGILNMTGPAEIMISSYAMGETPARIISQLKDKGFIKSLRCVLDNRVDVRSAGSLQLIKSVSDDFALVDTHAKVTLIRNDEWQLKVMGSANYTENIRKEEGVITTCKASYEMSERWINKALQDGIR